MVMTQRFTLSISLLLCLLLAFTNGCTKIEEPQKPGVSDVRPLFPGAVDKSGSPAAQELPAGQTPIPDKAGLPSAAPEKVAPVVPRAVPGVPVMPMKPADKDIVLVAGFDSPQMQKGAPAGWLLDRKKGTPFLELERGSEIYCLHMLSKEESSFGVKRGITVDIKEFPYLNWRWKAVRLPEGGDVRKTQTDDQAIQLYVAFTPTGFPAALNTPVVGYIWDNEAPKGWTGRSTQIGGRKLKYVVVRNNTDQLGQWYTEKRNIYEDYRKLFKDVRGAEPPTMTHGVQFHINSQNTGSTAEGSICEVYFSRS
jgi:hypothetical protein